MGSGEQTRAEDELRRSEDQLAHERDRLTLLLEINNYIVSKLEANELFHAVAQSMRKHFGNDLTSFLLLNRESGCLERKFLDFPTGRGFLEKVVVTAPSKLLTEWWRLGTPVFYSPAETEIPPALREADRAESILSAVSVPLVGADGPLGLLNMGSQKPNAFSEADRDLLSQIGTQISLAVDNALIYGRLRGSHDDLQRSEAYLAEAQRLSHTGSWALDLASDKYVYVSEECLRIYGFDPKEGLPSRETVFQRIHPEDLDRVKERFEKSVREKVDSSDELRIVLPDRTIKHIQVSRHPVLNSAGNVVTLVGTSVDITERKRAEEERERLRQLEADLAHINRVSMMGELAASIAHEVNQPLSGVVSNGSACLRWLAGDAPNVEEARDAVRRIVRDGKRATEVVTRIRTLTKRAAMIREKLDLNETIREVLALIGDEAKKNSVVIRMESADDIFPVFGDRVELQQVVLNLVMNAIEAMRRVGERARELVITTRNIDADQVQATVEDSGTGLDANTIAKIFDPFYTTKPGGMGMGLSISRSILEAHGGRLWATARNGSGTAFHFTVPKYHDEQSNAGTTGT